MPKSKRKKQSKKKGSVGSVSGTILYFDGVMKYLASDNIQNLATEIQRSINDKDSKTVVAVRMSDGKRVSVCTVNGDWTIGTAKSYRESVANLDSVVGALSRDEVQ